MNSTWAFLCCCCIFSLGILSIVGGMVQIFHANRNVPTSAISATVINKSMELIMFPPCAAAGCCIPKDIFLVTYSVLYTWQNKTFLTAASDWSTTSSCCDSSGWCPITREDLVEYGTILLSQNRTIFVSHKDPSLAYWNDPSPPGERINDIIMIAVPLGILIFLCISVALLHLYELYHEYQKQQCDIQSLLQESSDLRGWV